LFEFIKIIVIMNSSENKTETKKTERQELFSHCVGEGKAVYIEREVEQFDFEGYEVVPHEMFSQRRVSAK